MRYTITHNHQVHGPVGEADAVAYLQTLSGVTADRGRLWDRLDAFGAGESGTLFRRGGLPPVVVRAYPDGVGHAVPLLLDGLATDGAHHKQYYLVEALRALGAVVPEDCDPGVAP